MGGALLGELALRPAEHRLPRSGAHHQPGPALLVAGRRGAVLPRLAVGRGGGDLAVRTPHPPPGGPGAGGGHRPDHRRELRLEPAPDLDQPALRVLRHPGAGLAAGRRLPARDRRGPPAAHRSPGGRVHGPRRPDRHHPGVRHAPGVRRLPALPRVARRAPDPQRRPPDCRRCRSARRRRRPAALPAAPAVPRRPVLLVVPLALPGAGPRRHALRRLGPGHGPPRRVVPAAGVAVLPVRRVAAPGPARAGAPQQRVPRARRRAGRGRAHRGRHVPEARRAAGGERPGAGRVPRASCGRRP